jgi:hypothetical protein
MQVRVSGECGEGGVVPWVALQVMADGHGGSVEQGAW